MFHLCPRCGRLPIYSAVERSSYLLLRRPPHTTKVFNHFPAKGLLCFAPLFFLLCLAARCSTIFKPEVSLVLRSPRSGWKGRAQPKALTFHLKGMQILMESHDPPKGGKLDESTLSTEKFVCELTASSVSTIQRNFDLQQF